MIEREGIKPASETPAAIMASLSLYLIILAFFIMMNTISQLEGSRTEGVLDSINASFKDYPQTTVVTLDMAGQGAGEKEAPGFEAAIEELFKTAFPLAMVEMREGFDEIEVTLPLDSMFIPDSTDIRGRNVAILDRLAGILEFQAPGKTRAIEALLSWPPRSLPDEPLADSKLTIDRAGALARELTARGVAASAIAIGMERRNADIMRLRFVNRTIEGDDGEAKGRP